MNNSDPQSGRDLGAVWEEELFASAKRSAQRAWIAASLCAGLAALALGHSFVTLTRHSVEPVVIAVDERTGTAEVKARLAEMDLASDEAVTQAHLYRYVRDRESFDPADNAARIERVYAESSGQAAESLYALWGERHERHPAVVYGQDGRVAVRIRSISFIDAETASLRIRKLFGRGGLETARDFVVTVKFAYARGGERLLEAIWQNPLGFTVTSYRIDAETFEENGDA